MLNLHIVKLAVITILDTKGNPAHILILAKCSEGGKGTFAIGA